MNVGEMQRKLSRWAAQDKGHKFFDLYHLLYDTDWLWLAHDRVSQNAGSKTAGCDGVTMKLFDENLEGNLQQLAEELRAETFQPEPVRRVCIPKPDGRVRPLGIHAIRDRIVQEALRMILEPIYEADFSQHSYGFRPNRCTMDAVKRAAATTIGRSTYYWIIEGDLSSYFDTINHRKLVKLIRRRVDDKKLIRLIWKFLRAGMMEGKLFRDTELGVAQGGIVSPLFANIYLHELDRYMEKYTALTKDEKRRRRLRAMANYNYSRYADDFVVLCNGTKAQAEAMKGELYSFLQTLRLELSQEKTAITHLNDGFKFLGYWIRRSPCGNRGLKTKVTIPEVAVEKLKAKIAAATAPGTHKDSLNAKLLALNRIIEGWCRYYQYTSKASTQFSQLRPYLFWKVVHWIGRKHRLSSQAVMRRYCKGSTIATEQHRLTMPDEIKTRIYRECTTKPNPYTMQGCPLDREELPSDVFWTGYEMRPGIEDLRHLILKRDGGGCQMCGKAVTTHTYELDHIKAVKRFRRPVEANHPDNLWVLCLDCHREKTKSDRQMESPLPGKLARRVRRGA